MKNDGGQAFPTPYVSGMSLRDYFAAKAMQSWWVDPNINWTSQEVINKSAERAYAVADAMLEARK